MIMYRIWDNNTNLKMTETGKNINCVHLLICRNNTWNGLNPKSIKLCDSCWYVELPTMEKEHKHTENLPLRITRKESWRQNRKYKYMACVCLFVFFWTRRQHSTAPCSDDSPQGMRPDTTYNKQTRSPTNWKLAARNNTNHPPSEVPLVHVKPLRQKPPHLSPAEQQKTQENNKDCISAGIF